VTFEEMEGGAQDSLERTISCDDMSRRLRWTLVAVFTFVFVIPIVPALILWLWSGIVGG
jgi:hypothetical protein